MTRAYRAAPWRALVIVSMCTARTLGFALGWLPAAAVPRCRWRSLSPVPEARTTNTSRKRVQNGGLVSLASGRSGGEEDGGDLDIPSETLGEEDRLRLEASRDNLDLKMRMEQIKKSGGGDAGALVQILTESTSVGEVLQNFFMSASPMVASAMREAVSSLLGGLPREVDVQYKTTQEKLANLAGMMQMTGYMFRNAEYVVTLQQLLNIKSRTLEEYKKVFDEIDTDRSGFIDSEEVETLLKSFYGGEEVPRFEIEAFVRFFDKKKRGKISWSDFKKGFGLTATTTNGGSSKSVFGIPPSDPLLLGGDSLDDDLPLADVTVEGTIKLRFPGSSVDQNSDVASGVKGGGASDTASDAGVGTDGGSQEIEMDVVQYLDGLRAEAEALRAAIRLAAEAEARELGVPPSSSPSSSPDATSLPGTGPPKPTTGGGPSPAGGGMVKRGGAASLAEYISQLPPKQREALTEGIEPQTVEAMRRLIDFMVSMFGFLAKKLPLESDNCVTSILFFRTA